MLAYELLVGAPPFEADSKAATYAAILEKQPWLPQHLSAAARDFVTLVGRGGWVMQACKLNRNAAIQPALATLAPLYSLHATLQCGMEQAWHHRPGEECESSLALLQSLGA